MTDRSGAAGAGSIADPHEPLGGVLSVVGLGPGRPDWLVPEAAQRIAEATDLVGYGRYLDLVPVPTSARLHRSGNRVESARAVLALELADAGNRVVLVSSGDPGVFAMAGAVVEQLDCHPDRWREVRVEIVPGVSAAQALASRVGAPLGHDFCSISLSDVLKPWEVVERRLRAAASADFVVALYNPASRHRPWQFARAVGILSEHRPPATPVVLGRDVGRPGERVSVVTLHEVHEMPVDMRTIVVVGSSATRMVAGRPKGTSVYTPRWYGGEGLTGGTGPAEPAEAPPQSPMVRSSQSTA